MKEVRQIRKISKKTIILPEIIPFVIPDFKKHSEPVIPNVLSFKKINSEQWFYEFVSKIESKISKEYFPVMRLSDGEYSFLLGEKYPGFYGIDYLTYIKQILSVTRRKLFINGKFNAATRPGVSSGNYNFREIRKQQSNIINCMRKISNNGILALHLTYSLKPFQEKYHYSLKKWLEKNQIYLNKNNYYPFYFVYALLRGRYKERILRNKKIIVFHSAQGKKREQIIRSLRKEGVVKVFWHEISPNRSMFDKIQIKTEYFTADLALVGAGVGKFNILSQLEPLNIPCIDAGFVFEVWANENNKWKRPIMVPDEEWEKEKILFYK